MSRGDEHLRMILFVDQLPEACERSCSVVIWFTEDRFVARGASSIAIFLCCGATLLLVMLPGLILNRLACSDLAGRGPFGQTSRMGCVLRNQTLNIVLSKSNSVPYIDSVQWCFT